MVLPFKYLNVSTRSNGFNLYKHFSRLNIRKFSFSQRVINDWNDLPMEVVQTPNVILFKAVINLTSLISYRASSDYCYISLGLAILN